MDKLVDKVCTGQPKADLPQTRRRDQPLGPETNQEERAQELAARQECKNRRDMKLSDKDEARVAKLAQDAKDLKDNSEQSIPSPRHRALRKQVWLEL